MAAPSPGYSITVRVESPTEPTAIARLSVIVAEAGGAITALDVAESHPTMLVVDVSCNASDVAHSVAITTAIDALDGFTVRKVSDRTFLMHLGGKIEVTPKVELKHRDDLPRVYPRRCSRVSCDR
jgi:malate dehydrogenase (oxaloacetate-decarboxylating)